MNVAGLQNKAGELMKHVEELLVASKLARNTQASSKYAYEDAEQRIGDLQAFLYSTLMQDKELVWANPNPVLLADGTTPMPEFEAQYRSMYANYLIQNNATFQELMKERNDAKQTYYDADKNIVSIMEEIGVTKAEISLIAALLRVADVA